MRIFSPALLLRVEGAAVFASSCILYHTMEGSWLWFGLLFLAPDISLLGFLRGGRIGAAFYNFIHSYTIPLVIAVILIFTREYYYLWIVLIWFAHIGCDRLVGYGLKYVDSRHTHLQNV